MRLDHYHQIIKEVEDLEIDTSTPSKFKKTLMKLKRKKRILRRLKKKLMEDIRDIEVDYLIKRIAIRQEIEDYEANPSTFKKLVGKDSHTLRLKALKKIEKDRETRIKPYNEIREQINKLLDDIDETLMELTSPGSKVKKEFNPPEFR
ncbi:hypothetical protein [Methanothermobacter tenebrarum]|uniref:hypothetical protein n=1 Tax=Methanothermobacter tenebrarum TaxID=680118 RepID=UPI0011BCF7E4|nr:hypothetical protein [Methanothermobacter tenebrarum]NPV64977.1 hypothetical protein [Methanobacteriaceae archaeon]